MKEFFRFLGVGILSSVFCLGLQAEPKKSLAERSPFGNKPKPVAPPPKAIAPPRPVPKTLEFRGVAVSGGRVYCVLFDKIRNRGTSVALRDSSAEYFVERYDDKTQTIVVRTPNGSQTLGLQNFAGALGGNSSRAYASNGRTCGGRDVSSPFNSFSWSAPDLASSPFGISDDESDESDWSFDEED
ncbi:MAG: hypothetical protein LBT57_03410 [Puniceicoccales bacterium]|jgi:hypothetical protein|nr:hypothetical protein [Puniceicoccales bacterium]